MTMDLTDYVVVLRRYWRTIAVTTAAFVAVAALVTLAQPRVYSANANGFVTSGRTSDASLAEAGDAVAKSRAKSYIDIATSRATAQAVIQQLHLRADPAELIKRVTVEQPLDTVLLKITATAPSGLAAQQLADTWVEALARQVDSIEDPQAVRNAANLRLVPVEAAELPTSPSSPRTEVNLLLGLLLGLVAGLVLALTRNRLDRRVRSVADVEERFTVPVVGAIPAAAALTRSPDAALSMVVNEDRPSTAEDQPAEAFRKLRTNLRFMAFDQSRRVMVVTSPESGDGKSVIAANLAAAIAASGEPVVLVDGDLRRPSLAGMFGMAEGPGLTDVLAGRLEAEDVMTRVSPLTNLQVLPAGGPPQNPSEMLGSKAMSVLLGHLAERYIVVLDAPPLLPVTDAAVLAALTDGALVVVQVNKTVDADLASALAQVETVGGTVLGVIFNRVAPQDSRAGHYQGNYSVMRRIESARHRATRTQPSLTHQAGL
jgi:capsular exopolysaccharide synthesis family protein